MYPYLELLLQFSQTFLMPFVFFFLELSQLKRMFYLLHWSTCGLYINYVKWTCGSVEKINMCLTEIKVYVQFTFVFLRSIFFHWVSAELKIVKQIPVDVVEGEHLSIQFHWRGLAFKRCEQERWQGMENLAQSGRFDKILILTYFNVDLWQE